MPGNELNKTFTKLFYLILLNIPVLRVTPTWQISKLSHGLKKLPNRQDLNPLFSDLEPGWAPDPVPLPGSSSQEVASARQDRLLCRLPQTLKPHRGKGLPSPFPGPAVSAGQQG